MTLNQIKAAVDAGLTVHWSNTRYTVKKNANGYYIDCERGAAVGLTWLDGVTMNGKPEDFFVASTVR